MRSPRRYFAASFRSVNRSTGGFGPPYTTSRGLLDIGRDDDGVVVVVVVVVVVASQLDGDASPRATRGAIAARRSHPTSSPPPPPRVSSAPSAPRVKRDAARRSAMGSASRF